jgi:hypothetical protein
VQVTNLQHKQEGIESCEVPETQQSCQDPVVIQGNCTVVLDEIEYRDKINTLLKSGIYEPLSKDTIAKVERNVQQILVK